MKVPTAETLGAKGAQTRKATPPGKRMVPMPGRADGATPVEAMRSLAVRSQMPTKIKAIESRRCSTALLTRDSGDTFVHQLFPELENADFNGTVSVHSIQQIAVAALVFDPSGVATIPVVPIE